MVLLEGRGRLRFADGGFVDGTFDRGEIEGEGTKWWPSGACYKGQFHLGEAEGQGTFQGGPEDPVIYFAGSWRSNLYHGAGVLQARSGHRYTGTWVQHRMEGDGAMDFVMVGVRDKSSDPLPEELTPPPLSSIGGWDGDFTATTAGLQGAEGTVDAPASACVSTTGQQAAAGPGAPVSERYVGQWVAGARIGEGSMQWSTGVGLNAIYHGQWVQGPAGNASGAGAGATTGTGGNPYVDAAIAGFTGSVMHGEGDLSFTTIGLRWQGGWGGGEPLGELL